MSLIKINLKAIIFVIVCIYFFDDFVSGCNIIYIFWIINSNKLSIIV